MTMGDDAKNITLSGKSKKQNWVRRHSLKDKMHLSYQCRGQSYTKQTGWFASVSSYPERHACNMLGLSRSGAGGRKGRKKKEGKTGIRTKDSKTRTENMT